MAFDDDELIELFDEELLEVLAWVFLCVFGLVEVIAFEPVMEFEDDIELDDDMEFEFEPDIAFEFPAGADCANAALPSAIESAIAGIMIFTKRMKFLLESASHRARAQALSFRIGLPRPDHRHLNGIKRRLAPMPWARISASPVAPGRTWISTPPRDAHRRKPAIACVLPVPSPARCAAGAAI